MADYTSPNLTTAVVGVASTAAFQVQSTNSYTIEPSNGTVTGGNYSIESLTSLLPGWLTGRRPVLGQLFPRGVYNK